MKNVMRVVCLLGCASLCIVSACAPLDESDQDATPKREPSVQVEDEAVTLAAEALMTLGAPAPYARQPWPGGSGVDSVDSLGAFASNLSGLAYEPASPSSPAVLWAVQNWPSKLYRLLWNGSIWSADASNGWSSGKALRYPSGSGNPDAEAVARAEYADSAIYVAAERNNDVSGTSRLSVLRYDLNQSGVNLVATREWNLTGDLPAAGANLGLEALTFVPDDHLVADSFIDESVNARYVPAAYPNHGRGLFLVGVEGTGMVYAYALDQVNGTFRRIAKIQSGSSSVMGLAFERDTGKLWTYCDNTCGNTAGILAIDKRAGSSSFGRFVLLRQHARPAGLPNANNEGIAIAPEAECIGGLKSFFWADDGATNGHSLRAGFLQCGLN